MEKYARFNYQPCLPLGKGGKRVTASRENAYVSKKAALEGMVLLKNKSSALPLPKGEKVALFGKATLEFIKGGGGSGDVHCAYVRNIFDGMSEKAKDGKVFVYQPLIDFYREYVAEGEKNVPTQEQINKTWDIVNAMPFCQKRDDITYDTFQSMHVKEAFVPDELIDSASGFADTAIIILSRFSAEGTDRRAIPGDYYLSDLEKDLITRCAKKFEKVIVIINSGAVIDCEFFADNDDVDAVLICWQPGMEGGSAVADILCGDETPSGKLPDTIAVAYDCYPSSDGFGESFDYVNYTEDIYVGYRYFLTIPGMKDKIRYPFGYGLSYTDFEITDVICTENNGRLSFAFNVTNTGGFPGKEVVQVYFSAPQGKLGKPALQLAAFCKTDELKPGETRTYAVDFPISQMASYDDTGKISASSYVLEKGTYGFFIGKSCLDCVKTDFEYSVSEDTVTEKLTRYLRPFLLKKRLLSSGKYEKLETGDASYISGDPEVEPYVFNDTSVSFDKVGEDISLSDFINQMTIDEMADFVGGHAPTGVANTGCFGGLRRLGIPAVPTADGPAGLRLEEKTGISTTAFPCATLLASTWNEDIVNKVGAAAAAEIRENNLGVWLAPALNIHRDTLCGRNFEYFSEDPLLAGKSAAAEVRGIQSQKVAVSIKHFACNNKEANRFGSDSRVSERALREIYLKCFEIVVREAFPLTVMSSYNLINGRHTSESYELLTGILRKEWGFKGLVTTDWGVKNDPVEEIIAGNDMKMHMGYPEDLKKGLETGRITPDHLKICVMRILDVFTHLAD